jgi:acetyl esterase
MPSLRTKLALLLLNKHASIMRSMSLSQARSYFSKISKPKFTTKINSVQDGAVESGTQQLKVRIYKDKLLSLSTTILYFHGGGFIYGDLESHDNICRLLARRTGLRVVAVDYRLAPEYPYPASVEDGQTVLEWLLHSDEKTQHYILAGDSAGASIILDLALSQPEPDVSGLILLYPALDPSLSTASMEMYKTRYFLTRDDMRRFWQMYLENAPVSRTWPYSQAQLSTLPPILIIGAGQDVLVDEAVAFSKQLTNAGVHCKYVRYDDMVHGFMHWPRAIGKRDQALVAIATFCNELVIQTATV